ncbi:MAG: hypothetical protein KDE27_28995 [Planctomycetes bacterium]|nr:hypothetical protein [Planctomycetota bacterium]
MSAALRWVGFAALLALALVLWFSAGESSPPWSSAAAAGAEVGAAVEPETADPSARAPASRVAAPADAEVTPAEAPVRAEPAAGTDLVVRLHLTATPAVPPLVDERVRIRALLERFPSGLVGRRPPQLLGEFDLAAGLDQRAESRVARAGENRIRWLCDTAGARGVTIATQVVGADEREVDSECALTPAMCLTGRVVDERGSGVAGVPVVLMVRAADQVYRCRVDSRADGWLRLLVPPNATGDARLEWADGNTAVPWTAGQYFALAGKFATRLALRIVDREGRPLELCRVARYAAPLRDAEGRVPVFETEFRATVDGVLRTEWTTLPAGTRLYVRAPGRGECVCICGSDLRPGPEPHEIRCDDAAHGAVRFTFRGDPAFEGRRLLSIHLRATSERRGGPELRVTVGREVAATGWTAHEVHPGDYDYEILDGGATLARGGLAVRAGELTQLAFP